MKSHIAITMGDAAGIGPEIIAKTLSRAKIYELCRPLVVGDEDSIIMGIEVSGLNLGTHVIKEPSGALFEHGVIDVLDLDNIDIDELVMGRPQAMAGKASVEFVIKAAEMALKGDVDAIVTAPINKEAINMAGYSYTGHTGLLAELSGVSDYAMMLTAGDFRVIHVTTHIPLKDVSMKLSIPRVLSTIRLAHSSVKQLGIQNPRIAVAGLNPHCGEGGLFGKEELEIIRPAIKNAKETGIDVYGPIPPDTVFAMALGKAFDIVVAMYHDQGHIPVKMIGFRWGIQGWESIKGVNITVGLPFIRTSVDHGTAYGKAGRGEGNADPESLIEAVETAIKMSLKNT